MSFLLFECVIAFAVLLALAEIVSWWAVAALPAAVAAMVKFNDLVSATTSRDGGVAPRAPAACSDDVGADAAIAARSSRIYVSGSRAAEGGVKQVVPVDSGTRPPRTATRRSDEADRVKGSTNGARSTGRTRTREPRVAEAGTDRAEVVARPEWRQTITLGRHARDDGRAGRGPDSEHDATSARHRAGPANQRRFA
jgi:hypothetical protein